MLTHARTRLASAPNTTMIAAAVHAAFVVARPRVASSRGAKHAGVGDPRRVETGRPTRRSTVARGGELSWDEAEQVLSLECVQRNRDLVIASDAAIAIPDPPFSAKSPGGTCPRRSSGTRRVVCTRERAFFSSPAESRVRSQFSRADRLTVSFSFSFSRRPPRQDRRRPRVSRDFCHRPEDRGGSRRGARSPRADA